MPVAPNQTATAAACGGGNSLNGRGRGGGTESDGGVRVAEVDASIGPDGPDGPDDDVSDKMVELVQMEIVENALDIAGPIIDRVSSRSFEWVNEAFSHADAYLEGLHGGAPGSSTPAADVVGAHPSSRETRTVWADSTDVGGAEGTGDDGLTRPPAVAAVDPSDDETEATEPARFPSRSDRDDDWGAADADAWVPEAVLKRRREKGATFWLVKWKYVTEPTWEHESDLIDEGHQPLLAAYNAIGTKKEKEASTRRDRERRARGSSDDQRNTENIASFDPCTFWPDFHEQIVAKFNACNLRVDSIRHCLTANVSKQFVGSWSHQVGKGESVAPAMLFHGTNQTNWHSIASRGFYIPGQGGVRVVNGSAYGVGIYTATRPNTSCSYVRGESAMFVCAGLIENKFATSVKRAGDIVVFFNQARVVPCALVTYRYGIGVQPPCMYTIDTSLSFSSWPKHAKLRYAVERYEAAAQFWSDPTEVTEKTILQQTGGRVSKKQLKQLPTAAKGMWKDGKFSNPKSDRSKR
eukprot:m.373447 g.373447  ORF g.373447 m.373447 type:complete len:522 (-) comp28162_c0_seq10:2145-3710(-)